MFRKIDNCHRKAIYKHKTQLVVTSVPTEPSCGKAPIEVQKSKGPESNFRFGPSLDTFTWIQPLGPKKRLLCQNSVLAPKFWNFKKPLTHQPTEKRGVVATKGVRRAPNASLSLPAGLRETCNQKKEKRSNAAKDKKLPTHQPPQQGVRQWKFVPARERRAKENNTPFTHHSTQQDVRQKIRSRIALVVLINEAEEITQRLDSLLTHHPNQQQDVQQQTPSTVKKEEGNSKSDGGIASYSLHTLLTHQITHNQGVRQPWTKPAITTADLFSLTHHPTQPKMYGWRRRSANQKPKNPNKSPLTHHPTDNIGEAAIKDVRWALNASPSLPAGMGETCAWIGRTVAEEREENEADEWRMVQPTSALEM